MDEEKQIEADQAARRSFLGYLGVTLAGGAATVAATAMLPKQTRAAADAAPAPALPGKHLVLKPI